MKKTTDHLLGALLVVLICFGVFLGAVLGTIIIKEVFLRDQPTAQAVDFECSSDCKQMPDFTIECQCHPVQK
jgi:hypothetical protein